jgi:molybdopterin converting factor small subunit
VVSIDRSLIVLENESSKARWCLESFTEKFSMKCSIKIFAGLREAIGDESITIDMNSGATAKQCKERLAARYPQVAELIAVSRLAVSQAFVNDEDRLPLDASRAVEIALIPPVSGG